MSTLPAAGRTLALLIVAGLVATLIAPGYGQLFDKPQQNTEEAGTPRLSVPTGHLLPRAHATASFTYRGASYKGRDMDTQQYSVAVGVTPDIELAWDRHELNVDGRTPGNRFEAEGTGYQVRYGRGIFGNDGALFLRYRTSEGEVRSGGALRIPPDAHTYMVGASASHPIGKDLDLHLLASGAWVDVGSEDAWAWTLGGGVDQTITKGLTAQGNFAFSAQTGDASGAEVGISGGLHYEHKSGLYADVMGTFLPSGAPISGNPLADGSAFILDPVFQAEPIVQDLQDASLGFYTIRAGWTTRF